RAIQQERSVPLTTRPASPYPTLAPGVVPSGDPGSAPTGGSGCGAGSGIGSGSGTGSGPGPGPGVGSGGTVTPSSSVTSTVAVLSFAIVTFPLPNEPFGP